MHSRLTTCYFRPPPHHRATSTFRLLSNFLHKFTRPIDSTQPIIWQEREEFVRFVIAPKADKTNLQTVCWIANKTQLIPRTSSPLKVALESAHHRKKASSGVSFVCFEKLHHQKLFCGRSVKSEQKLESTEIFINSRHSTINTNRK